MSSPSSISLSSDFPQQTIQAQTLTDVVPDATKTISNKPTKVTLLLKAAGNAPILKTKKWEVDEAWTMAFFQQSLRKILKLSPDQSLFIFVNQSFSPSPEHTIGTLQQCFGSEGSKLTLHYSTVLAWG